MDAVEEEAFPFAGGGDTSAAVPVERDGWEAVAPPSSPPHHVNEHGRGWEMVAVGASSHDDFSIFPPSCHEGLHFHPDPDGIQTLNLPSPERREADPKLREPSYFPPNGCEDEQGVRGEWRRISSSAKRTMELGFELVRYKLSRVGGYPAGVTVWSFAAFAGLVGALIYSRQRHGREKERLLSLIREKDQNITQMLHQIILLNEIIAARHQVHVIRRF